MIETNWLSLPEWTTEDWAAHCDALRRENTELVEAIEAALEVLGNVEDEIVDGMLGLSGADIDADPTITEIRSVTSKMIHALRGVFYRRGK